MQLASTGRRVAVVVCCAMLAACGDGLAPRDPDVSLDMLLADFSDVHALRDQLIGELSLYLVANDSMPPADACPYDASVRRFVCPATISNGLTLTRSFQLLDASGLPQSAFSPTETRAIRAIADLNGTVAQIGTPPSTYGVSSHSEHTLSGLPNGTHTLSGVRSTTFAASLIYPTDTVTSSTTVEETTGLAMPKRGMGSPYPQSGTLMSKIEQSTPGHDISVTVTFNGTSVVTRTTRTNGETETCTLDLLYPDARPVCFVP